MDLASVVAALASVGVRVSGSTPNSSVQVDSSRACPTGLAGPEPSGTFHDPGQQFQGIGSVASSLPLAGPDEVSILEFSELISVWAETAHFQLPTPRG